MPAWGELQAHVRKNLRMLGDEPDSMILGWQRREEDGSLSQQTLFVRELNAYGEPWLVMFTDVCPQTLLDPHAALALNGELPLGALVLIESAYVLRYTLNIKSLPLEDILAGMERLTWAAAQIRQKLLSGAPQQEAALAPTAGIPIHVHVHRID